MRKLKLISFLIPVSIALAFQPRQKFDGHKIPDYELTYLIGALENSDHLSFDGTIYSETSDSSGLKSDTLSVSFNFNQDKFNILTDSTNIIQDEAFNMTIDHQDSLIFLKNRRSLYPYVFQLDILDADFRDLYVDSLAIYDTTRQHKIVVFFKPTAPFKSFSLYYDTSNYQIQCVKLRIRQNLLIPLTPTSPLPVEDSYYRQIKVVYSNYRNGVMGDSAFRTAPFIQGLGTGFKGVGGLADYQLVDQTRRE